jgi:hypothetical protein
MIMRHYSGFNKQEGAWSSYSWATGSGKGTQAARLREYGFVHSTQARPLRDEAARQRVWLAYREDHDSATLSRLT